MPEWPKRKSQVRGFTRYWIGYARCDVTIRASQPRQTRSVGGVCEPDRTAVGMSLPGVQGLASRVVGFTAKRTLLIVLLLTVSDRMVLTNTAFAQALKVARTPSVSITDIEQFLNTCPEGDPATSQIRADIEIRRDLVLVSEIPCSEPVSEMPIAEYTDELILLQGLRVAYYMDFGRSGHLPWTSGSFYDWMKSKIGGFTITSGGGGGFCCTTIDGRLYPTYGAADEFQRNVDRRWRGIAGNIAFLAHEVRHVDGFPHVTGCPVAGYACDQTFDLANLSPYGIQWWLNANWLNGNISVGFSCMSPEIEVRRSANWHLGATASLAQRFIDVKPPAVTMPQFPGGVCMADLDRPLLLGVLDAAGGEASISPGSVVSVFGNFTEQTALAGAIPLPVDLGGFSVTFNGIPGALFGVFDGPFDQSNVQVPWNLDVSSGKIEVKVHWKDDESEVWSDPFEANAALASPGIYMHPPGTTQAIVTNFKQAGDDVISGSWTQPSGSIPGVVTQPAAIGGVATIWCNGLGPVNPVPVTGDLPQPPGTSPITDKIVRVFVGGVEAQVLGAVLQSSSVGLNQINIFIPEGVTPGDAVPIVIEVECPDGTKLRSREDATIAVRTAP